MKITEALGWFYLSMDSVKSPTTIVFYKRRLSSLANFLGDVEVDDITIDHLRAWRKSLGERQTLYQNHPTHKPQPGRLSVHTLDQHVRAARRFFRWLHTEGRIDHNPAARLERPQLPKQRRRGIPKMDALHMMKAAQSENHLRDYAMIRLLADTACRVAGIAGLRMGDLDLANRRAIVHEKGRGGNNKERPIFLNQKTIDALTAYLKVRPASSDDHVFLGEGRGKGKGRGKSQTREWRGLTENGIYQALKRIAKRAGVESGFNPHNFRHGAIRGWLNRGMPLSKASELAGHSSTKVTGDIYGTSNDDELAAAHDRWGWID